MKKRKGGSTSGRAVKRGKNSVQTSKIVSIETLHDQMCQKLQQDPDQLMEYLLDCQPYLKSQDVGSWKTRFLTSPAPEMTEVNRGDLCQECMCQCVLDVINNIAVCQDCGTVTDSCLLLIDTGHTSYERLKRIHKKRPHFYNPLTHFRDYMKQLTGMEHFVLKKEDEQSLRRVLVGCTDITPTLIEKKLREVNLNKKYLRNCVSLAVKFGKYKPARIRGLDYIYAMKMFVSLTKYWKWHKHELAPGRKSFMNYPFVFRQISLNLGRTDWIDDVRTMKHKKSLKMQHDIWSRMCKHLPNFKHFM